METEPPEPTEPQRPGPTPDEQFVREQEDAAAAEAGAIGGRREPGDEHDEAMRPLEEAGEGEAEGFEEAERELVEHASHGDPAPDPSAVAGEAEDEEAREGGVEYGDADHVESSEREGLDEQ
jgi:hypothetical protein